MHGKSYSIAIVLVFASLSGAWIGTASPLCAQEAIVTEGLQSALKRLASPEPRDWTKSEAALVAAMKNPAERERATCAMAVFHIKRGNTKAITNLCRQMDRLFPQKSTDLNFQLLRIQLWNDLATEQAEQATKRFSLLLESTLKGDGSKASNLANAAMLGAIVGMLECAAAQSPIALEPLSRAKAVLGESNRTRLTDAFTTSYDEAAAYANSVDVWLQTNSQLPIDEAAQAAQRDLDAIQTEYNSKKQSAADTRIERREFEKTIYENKREIRSLEKKINDVTLTWNRNPQVQNPIEPDIRTIRVPLKKRERYEETERVEKTRWVTDKDGKKKEEKYYENEKVTKYEIVDKSPQEIEREIRTIFQRQMIVYTNLKNMHDELLKNKADFEQQLKVATDSLTVAEDGRDKLNEKSKSDNVSMKDLQSSARAVTEALNALKIDRPVSAFRPPSFEIFDYTLEENVLSD